MEIKRLANHPSAQCHIVIYDNGDIDFVSYATTVATIRHTELHPYITVNGLYSMTTRRQLTWFFNEYWNRYWDWSFADIKKIVGEDMATDELGFNYKKSDLEFID